MIDDRNRIYSRLEFLDEEEIASKIAKSSYRVAIFGDRQIATHAICRHGVIQPITANHHICGWTPLTCS